MNENIRHYAEESDDLASHVAELLASALSNIEKGQNDDALSDAWASRDALRDLRKSVDALIKSLDN